MERWVSLLAVGKVFNRLLTAIPRLHLSDLDIDIDAPWSSPWIHTTLSHLSYLTGTSSLRSHQVLWSRSNNRQLDIHQIVIFKIASDQSFRRTQIKESLAVAWNIMGDKINAYGEKIFRAQFLTRAEVERARRSGSWLFKNELVAMEKCHQWTLPENYKLDSCDFWIQIHNIPLNMLKEEIITYIVNDLGR